jgi:AraC-like DNA-binding protein
LSAYIRERRLDGARRALLATGRRTSVADIAARWQFADGGHFARLFRHRYGQTPTEYARAAEAPAPVTAPAAPSGR